jgi:protein SCO1/2
LAVLLAACAKPAALVGTELGSAPAPEFSLTDTLAGQLLALSALRGSVVVLAFLYTHCPDTCPLTAERFRDVQKALGEDAARVQFVAISVDPENDTPEAVRAFTAGHRLGTNWHYLLGERPQLEAIWALYGVGSFSNGTAVVSHNDAIYLIDAQGRERLLVHASTPEDDLASDLRALVREAAQ